MDDTNKYISDFKEKICLPNNHEFWIMGRVLKEVTLPFDMTAKAIHSFEDFEKVLDA